MSDKRMIEEMAKHKGVEERITIDDFNDFFSPLEVSL